MAVEIPRHENPEIKTLIFADLVPPGQTGIFSSEIISSRYMIERVFLIISGFPQLACEFRVHVGLDPGVVNIGQLGTNIFNNPQGYIDYIPCIGLLTWCPHQFLMDQRNSFVKVSLVNPGVQPIEFLAYVTIRLLI